MEATRELSQRIDAALSSMDEKRKQFQEMETRKYEEWKVRLAKLGATFDRLRPLVESRLELLIKKFGDRLTVTPKLTQSTRELVLDFQSDLARISLRFQGTTDHDIRKFILNYDLTIIPILMQFDSHAAIEMPLDAIDVEAAARWIDERIMSFVQSYVALHENPYYLRDQMVVDPVSKTTFPKLAAGATLERGGRTHYFVSEATRREYERQVAGSAT